MNQLIMQGLEGKLQTERSRIVGLCVTLTGNIDVATGNDAGSLAQPGALAR